MIIIFKLLQSRQQLSPIVSLLLALYKKKRSTLQKYIKTRRQQYSSSLLLKNKMNRNLNRSKFSIENIQQIDNLLEKNEKIYKNLRNKLEGIAKAQRNITNNINSIRPIYQQNKQNSFITQQSNIFTNQRYQSKAQPNSSLGYLNSKQSQLNKSYRNTSYEYNHYNSSPIQSQRILEQIKIKNIKNLLNKIQQEEKIAQNNYSQEIEKKKYYENVNQSVLMNLSLPIYQEQLVYHNELLKRLQQSEYSNKKNQIENIYKQLLKEQQQIQEAFRKYRKQYNLGLNKSQISQQKLQKVNTSSIGQQLVEKKNSPPKNTISKRSFMKKQKPQQSPSKMSSIQKNRQQNQSSSYREMVNQLYPVKSDNNIIPITQTNKYSKTNIKQNETTLQNYLKQQFQNLEISDKPLVMTARNHIFIPFNKLYKSPILQMKNQSTLILARQSKLIQQKTSQHKIIDGKKYKFQNSLFTQEQELFKNMLKQQHNLIAIVGGQSTLKKKLHIGLIAHSLDKILSIIYSGKYNLLTINLYYSQCLQKKQNLQNRISRSVQISDQSSIKVGVLQIQKTIQQICNSMKKSPGQSDNNSSNNKLPNNSNENKLKMIRFTKLILSWGKQIVFSSHIISTNKYNFEFIKNLQVKDIIWSVNPLVKNYNEVVKSLDQVSKYIQSQG